MQVVSDAGQRLPRTSKIARTSITGLATARVGAAQLRRVLSTDQSPQATAEHEARIGKILFAAMSQMRGTALKAAQVLSLDATFLPVGVRAELARATHRVTPLNRALVGRVFRQAFGCEPEALFSEFEHEAFAAASIGQVHRAIMEDGTTVAVKVQYPGIAATIDTDLRLLRRALSSIGPSLMPLPDTKIVDSVLDEIARQLHEEVNYLHEAEQQRWFQDNTAGSALIIADVVQSHTTTTVMTQQLLVGEHLDEWLASDPAQTSRNHMGQSVFDWFVECALRHRRIHADLHPGNFLFLPNDCVGVLDFGCTQSLSEKVASGLSHSWSTWLDEPDSTDKLLAIYRDLELVSPEVGRSVFDAEILPGIAPLLCWATEPFTQSHFDFSAKSLPPLIDANAHALVVKHMNSLPSEMLSIERAWLGLTHLLRRLGAIIDTRAARTLLKSQ